MNSSSRPSAFVIESRSTESERAPVAQVASVSSGFFDVLRIPLKKGRVFIEGDNSTGRQVAVINEALERRYWRGEDPIRQHIGLAAGPAGNRMPDLTIVGVVGDIKSDGFDVTSGPFIYVPEHQAPAYGSVVYLRTAVDPSTLGQAIRCEVQAVDPCC